MRHAPGHSGILFSMSMELPVNPLEQNIETDSSEAQRIKERIAFRTKQSFSERLAEYLTGLDLNSPEMIPRLIEDQKVIRAKYGLPQKDAILNSTEYELLLKNMAKKAGVAIRPKSECGDFFEKYRFAGAVNYSSEKKIGIDIDKSTEKDYARGLNALEHELIHSFQTEKYPSMPIELMEYEAYVAGGNMKIFETNPEAVEVVFGMLMAGSIGNWYSEESEKRGTTVKPEWNNPEFFLKKVDNINAEVKPDALP